VNRVFSISFFLSALLAMPVQADNYAIDIPGMHANVQFRVKHLGFSWLYGRFNKFDGEFSYDAANPAASKVSVTIDMTSLDSNHAERDKHLRADTYLDTDRYPEARFVSTRIEPSTEGHAKVIGQLTLHGVTREIVIDAAHVGAGDDPWGGFRRGFYGTATLRPSDYGIDISVLGPDSQVVELDLAIEGVRR